MEKKKCVLAGTGNRGIMAYIEPIVNGSISKTVQMCGIYDEVQKRAEICSRNYGNIPVFQDFETMLNQIHPDYVIVTTKDSNHHSYIIKALDMGYDVITEKPITNTCEKALKIMEAEKRSGHKVRVIFNLRYLKPIEDLKQIVQSGKIGDVRHVDYVWLLDRSHGADYYRRWHRYMENTTSLLVHKSTHHFDVANWVIGKKPASVFARGTLEFYGKNGKYRGTCCHKCSYTDICPFYMDITASEFNRKYYYDIENESGYYRDGCVFDEKIDIFDRMALNVSYEDGTTMNYSLTSYNPDEGMRIHLIGTKGRIEMKYYTSGPHKDEPIQIQIVTEDKKLEIVNTSFEEGEHGGADKRMLDDLFSTDKAPDPLGRVAGSYAGYLSLAIGDMAVRSIKSGTDIKLSDIENEII